MENKSREEKYWDKRRIYWEKFIFDMSPNDFTILIDAINDYLKNKYMKKE